MQQKRHMVLCILLIALFSSCARKLPEPGEQRFAMLAIPMKSIATGTQRFHYSYSLSGEQPISFQIKIQPGIGKDFAFSELLPAGEYAVDSYTVHGSPAYPIILHTLKDTVELEEKIYFTLSPGTILILDMLIEVKVESIDYETFTQQQRWKILENEELNLYVDKLKRLEGVNSWEIEY